MQKERFEEGMKIRHCALSLVGKNKFEFRSFLHSFMFWLILLKFGLEEIQGICCFSVPLKAFCWKGVWGKHVVI